MPGGRNPDNQLRITEVAEMNGVTSSAIRSWLTKNSVHSFVWRGERWVHKNVAARYARERDERLGGRSLLTRKPLGWLSIKQLEGVLGVCGDTARKYLLENPDIRAGKVNGTRWVVHPADAEVLRQRVRSSDPLPGWVALPDLAVELGRRLTTLHIIADRLGVETRFAARPGARAARHVTPEGAARLRAWSASAARGSAFNRKRSAVEFVQGGATQ